MNKIINIYLLIMGAVATGTLLATLMYVYIFKYDDVLPKIYLIIRNERYEAGYKVLNEELRQISHNLTRGCNNDDYCYVSRIYIALQQFQYIQEGGTIPLKTVWNSRTGDCVSLHQLFCGLLYQVNVDCQMECTKNHCWAKVLDGEYVVDLTMPTFMKREDYERRII